MKKISPINKLLIFTYKKLLFFGGFIYFLNTLLISTLSIDKNDIIVIHVLFFLVNLFLILSFLVVAYKWFDKAGWLFMSFFLVKAVILVSFVIIKNNQDGLSNTFIINFFSIYFSYLIYSVYSCYRILKFFDKKNK